MYRTSPLCYDSQSRCRLFSARRRAFVLLATICLTSATHSNLAFSALLAYDGFDYPNVGSDLLGNNGGFGFSNPWLIGGFNASTNTNYDIAQDNLSFGNLQTSGNRVQTGPTTAIAGLTRNLLQPMGTAGETRYVSVLLRPEGTIGSGAFNGFFGINLEQPGEPEVFAGKPGGGALGQYVIERRGGAFQSPTSANVELDTTTLLVLKAEFTSGLDTFSLFVNPTPGGLEPLTIDASTTGSVDTVTGLTIYSSGAFSLDELRYGETFADVVPVPEPNATFLLLLTAMIALRYPTRSAAA
ncbi:MAG: hypothetical protein R3E01_03175 [Pirellulaceae bacterium]|nr:hypothetical protein [Planctomycetales bacterium]